MRVLSDCQQFRGLLVDKGGATPLLIVLCGDLMKSCSDCSYVSLSDGAYCPNCGRRYEPNSLPIRTVEEDKIDILSEVTSESRELIVRNSPDVIPYGTRTRNQISLLDAETLAQVLQELPSDERRKASRMLKRASRKLKTRAKNHGNRAVTANTVGVALGGAVGTGGLVAIVTATAPIALPVYAVTAAGFAILVSGIGIGHRLKSLQNRFEENAEEFEDLSEEISDVY